jgi:hypothetical protein
VNVVERPTKAPGSRGLALTGHHEIMLPLFAAAVLAAVGAASPAASPAAVRAEGRQPGGSRLPRAGA